MSRFIAFLLFSILCSSNIYADKCFLYIEKPGNFSTQLTSTLAISLISQYIERLESIPLSGLGKHDCVYKLGVTESKEGMFVTITGRGLSAYGDSKKGGIDGLQHALLRSIYRAKLDRKEIICKAYGTILKEDCNLSVTTTNTASVEPTKKGVLQKEANGFNFVLNECFREENVITCELTITNLKNDRNLRVRTPSLYDNLGNKYFTGWQAGQGTFGTVAIGNSKKENWVTHLMVSEISTRTVIIFNKTATDAEFVALLNVPADANGEQFEVKFKNIPIN